MTGSEKATEQAVTGETVLVCRNCDSDWGVEESDDGSCLNCGLGTANPTFPLPVLAVWSFDRCTDNPCEHCKAGRPEAPGDAHPADLSGGVWELGEPVRPALPPAFHRPEWVEVGSPPYWACACCWGDGWFTPWPCRVATAHGGYVARSWRAEAAMPL